MAKYARKSGYHNQSFGAILQAERYLSERAILERAKLLYDRGNTAAAVEELSGYLNHDAALSATKELSAVPLPSVSSLGDDTLGDRPWEIKQAKVCFNSSDIIQVLGSAFACPMAWNDWYKKTCRN